MSKCQEISIATMPESELPDELHLPDGGYVCEILHIYNDIEKKCYHVRFDIYEGYYAEYFHHYGDDGDTIIVRYDSHFLIEFADFITALAHSNSDFKFKQNNEGWHYEWSIGLVIEEKDNGVDFKGNPTTRYEVTRITTADNIRNGNFTFQGNEQG
jgi:hypothetical protein